MEQSNYNNIFKLFLNKEYYNKYSKYVDQDWLKTNQPDYFRLLTAISELQSTASQDTSSIEDLSLVFQRLYPNNQSQSVLLGNIKDAAGDRASVVQYLESARRSAVLSDISLLSAKIATGTAISGDEEALSSKIAELGNRIQVNEEDFNFVSTDLEVLRELRRSDSGLKWRLPSLQRALGPLRAGDFGFLSARPETGKTTFLASEVSFMATQSDKSVLWFNNEEQGSKVMIRIYQAVFGIDLGQLYADVTKWKKKFAELGLDKRIKLYDQAVLRRKEVESVLAAFTPSLVIFDQIDKIQGFSADRPDLEHKMRYQWAREISKEHTCPVIGVCQAGATAENKKWLTMNDIDSSKTAKQGEADWILGIGAVADEGKEYLRYLHLCKNKLDGDDNTDPSMRHGKWFCNIRPEIARYEDA